MNNKYSENPYIEGNPPSCKGCGDSNTETDKNTYKVCINLKSGSQTTISLPGDDGIKRELKNFHEAANQMSNGGISSISVCYVLDESDGNSNGQGSYVGGSYA